MLKRILAVVAAAALVGATGAFVYTNLRPEPVCDACYRSIHGETHYRVFLENGEVEDVCCPRCGLRFQAGRDDVTGAEATDFYTRKPIDVESAFFVEGSSVVMCRHGGRLDKDLSGAQYQLTWDRCLPSLIAFSTRQEARAFQQESGGVIRTYDELLQEEY